MSSVYQLPSPPTQQPVSQVPYNGMAKTTSSQISTPKESMVNNLPGGASNKKASTVTTNGQPVQVNSKSAASGSSSLKAVTKRKSGYLYNPLKIDTSVASKSTPVSPTSQSSSPQPTSASSTTHSPRPKSNNNNTFVHKLYQMLSDPKQSNYIRWNETGYSFIIRNAQGFSHNVLPLHFRHNNFSSFVRQLNMYGFHKVNKNTPNTKGSENQVWEFFHPKFIRGKPHLIEEIKRKQIESENWRSNALLQDPTRLLSRHSSYYSNKNGGSNPPKRSNSNIIVTTATVTVGSNSEPLITPPEVPGQQGPISTTAPTSIPLTQSQSQAQAVYIQGSESIPSNSVTSVNVAVTSSGEQVIIDPVTAAIQNTPNIPMVQNLPVSTTQNIPGNYGVIQVPSQQMPYNDVSAAPSAHGTPIPQAMTMGNLMAQNPQAMVDPANVVVNGHPMMQEVQGPGNPQGPSLDNDIYYNIQLLQMQNQDMNQRLNDLQMNVNNLMNSYSRRMDMQQNMIQQLMNTAQQQQQQQQQQNQMPQNQISQNQSGISNVTVCSVDQGQALSNSYDVNPNSMVQQGTIVGNGIVTQSPIQHHQMLHQSPIQASQVMAQQNGYSQQPQTSEVLVTASPDQKIMNQNQTMGPNNESMDQYINPHQLSNGVAYSAQTIYY